MTTIAEIRADLAAIIAKIDAVAPEPTPVPVPTPAPVPPAPPVIGTTDAFGAAEIQTKLAQAKPGDTIVAKAGEIGKLALSGIGKLGRVTLLCESGAHFERITLANCSDVTIDGARVWPDKTVPVKNNAVIQAEATTSGIEILRALVRSAPDADDYANWSLAQWKAAETQGIWLKGVNSRMADGRVVGADIGTIINGAGSAMERMKIRGFAQDGMRVVGSGTGWFVRGCDVADCVSTTGGQKHPDGLQCWSALPGQAVGSGFLDGLEIIGNRWREWISAINSPLRIGMQALGLHNKVYRNVKILNNEGWVSTFWGAHVNAAQGAEVSGNRFYDINRTNQKFGMIGVTGANITAQNNVSGVQNYAPGAALSGNNKPDYATLPAMSLVD